MKILASLSRKLTIVLILCVFIATVPFVDYSYADTTLGTYSKLSFTNPNVYDVVANGTYSAVKKNGAWYYKFKKNSSVVFIKCSAFMGKVTNSFSNVNKTLTNTINNGKVGSKAVKVAYKTKTTSYNAALKDTNHIYYFSKLEVAAIAPTAGNSINLQTTLLSQVNFTYCNKVRERSNIVKPSTAKQYKNALKRNTLSNRASLDPQFKITITNVGSKKNYFVSNNIAGKGIANQTADVDKLLKIGYTIGKLAIKGLNFSIVYDLYKQSVGLQSQGSSEYKSRKTIRLSGENSDSKYCYCTNATFLSPISIQNNNDYFEIPIDLDKSLKTKSTKMKVNIVYTIPAWHY